MQFHVRASTTDHVIYVNPAYERVWGEPHTSLYEDPHSFTRMIHPEDLPRVRERLLERVGVGIEVALVQCGGVEEVTRIYHDGREETTTRERAPQVENLQRALQRNKQGQG